MTTPSLRSEVAQMMETAWREPGFCVPNAATYPFQWLWDSCFHCVIWNHLGSDRAEMELRSVFANQHPSGFIPHMTYWGDPEFATSFWGRSEMSTITQPPMYGHVIAELERTGTRLDEEIFAQAARGLMHLFSNREQTSGGLIPILHPWESGCDDSARWDSWREPLGTMEVEAWRSRKGELVQSLELDQVGAPVANGEFSVGSVGFNALVSWNTQQLLGATEARSESFSQQLLSELTELKAKSAELAEAVAQRWDPELLTWLDDGPVSGNVRTADALLGLLIDPKLEAFQQLIEVEAFGGHYGVRGTHKQEPTYEPGTYWRGSTWPQLTYLLALAARSHSVELSSEISRRFVAGAVESRLAEYWHPETGQGLGAIPQTWTGLALVVQELP